MSQLGLGDIGPPTARCTWGLDRDGVAIYRYRYDLEIGDWIRQRCTFLMLNPSTADEDSPDPTVARCIGFARSFGYDRLTVVNLFALRATDPKVMLAHADPIGPRNDYHIDRAIEMSALVVCAWGNHGKHRDRARRVADRLAAWGIPLHCLGTNADGSPKHPLYLKANTRPQPWRMTDAQS